MRAIVYLALLGILVAGIVYGLQRYRSRAISPGSRPGGIAATTPLGLQADIEERAAIAYGSDRGPGVLRLTPSQLVFTADSGRITVLERIAVVGATTTRALPDHDVAKPVLVVTTPAETWYIAVSDPEQWVARLT